MIAGTGADWFFDNISQDQLKNKKASDAVVNLAGW